VASAVAALVWVGAAVIVLERNTLLRLGLDAAVTVVLVWVLAALLGLGTVLNVLSRSKWERLIWAPIAATALLVCVVLALAGEPRGD
jgi:hypothetical protein